jgi:hypothetical protein
MSLQVYFLGATVRTWNANVGWGQASQLQISLVEDPLTGDAFGPYRLGIPAVGQPVYFQHGGFSFGGLLQRWDQRMDVQGRPVFDAVVVDPREILEGASVLTGGYAGVTGGVPNLFNVYGYWENQGYGLAGSSDAGMPWAKVLAALVAMADTPGGGPYGGPLSYRGYTYSLDLSELPVPPPEYRVGGGQAGLLELIASICEDGCCDWFVELDGFTIVVRTIPRYAQPPLGTIASFVAASQGSVSRSASGQEARNELTSSFLIGGEVCELHTTTGLKQFWGYDAAGQPITGTTCLLWQATLAPGVANPFIVLPPPVLSPNPPAPLPQLQWGQVGTDTYETMTLDASPIADLLGSTSYACSTLEMRLAKVDYTSWSFYMRGCRPDMADRIPIRAPLAPRVSILGNVVNNVLRGIGLVNDNAQNAQLTARAAILQDQLAREQRVYQFVRHYADEYLGKKFLAPLPFLLSKQDSETFVVTTNWEVTDGGYRPQGSQPLGLSAANEDLFTTQDGRLRAFVRFDAFNVNNTDLSAVPAQGSVIEGGNLFVQCQVSPEVVYLPAPHCLLTLQGPVTEVAIDAVGNLNNALPMFREGNPAQVAGAAQNRFASVKISPQTQSPTSAAVPLRSNVLTYGPWYVAGTPGKVKVDQDPSLTPWNYGGYAELDAAAYARVGQAVSQMQVAETGSVEVPGIPAISLGDVLQAGGPNLTGIDVSLGPQGCTTSYRFATFTPRFGVFGKGQSERIKRAGLVAAELRRSLRQVSRDQNYRTEREQVAATSNRAFAELAPAAFRRQSPHDVLVAYTEQANGDVLTQVQSATFEEAVTLSNAHDDSAYQATALMSLNGLVRPFCTKPGGGRNMPAYPTPTVTGTVCNRPSLDPFKDKNDLDVYAWGDSYAGLNAYLRGGDHSNARPLALRGPLLIAGWGFDVRGQCFPADTGNPMAWASGHLTRQDTWGVGPLDALWNPYTGTWTCHGSVKGVLVDTLPATGGPAGMTVQVEGGTTWPLGVYNHFAADVPAGSRVLATYVAADNRWYVTAADCPA